MGQEIFPVMRGGAGMGQEKSMRGGSEDPILRPRPAPLPSLLRTFSVKFVLFLTAIVPDKESSLLHVVPNIR